MNPFKAECASSLYPPKKHSILWTQTGVFLGGRLQHPGPALGLRPRPLRESRSLPCLPRTAVSALGTAGVGVSQDTDGTARFVERVNLAAVT